MKIINKIDELPWHVSRTWDTRKLDDIKKLIIHQELGNSPVKNVNNYHITPSSENHLSVRGAPHFAYHFGIEKDGTIIQANETNQVTWHTRGQNQISLGCMLVGDFDGPKHKGTSNPTKEQKDSLEFLIETLIALFPKINENSIFGHCDFGKPACPGYEIMEIVNKYKNN